MKFLTTKQQKILYSFLKEHVGWLCPHSFQKKCIVDCWLHCFYFELEFAFEKNSFLSGVERQGIANRIIRKYEQKHFHEFDYYFNRS